MRLEIRHPRLGIGRGLNMPTKDAICFGCDTVQQIDATLSEASCKCGGNMRTLFSLEAFQIGRLAHWLGGRYYVHSSIIDVAASVDRSQPVDWANTREVERKDGTKHVFAFDHYLREAFENLKTKDDLNRVWIVGGLITLADALGKKNNRYFDRAPHLELVRHLRNGVAHGRFRIDSPDKLADHPANNFSASVKSPAGTLFEITPTTQGSVFDFMGVGDFIDLFFSVETHLLAYAIKL
jgi:hypothetical protein